jgi:phosphotransferase system HPr (HPr) family protein
MPERRVTVASKVGLHARPAALVAKAAATQPVAVSIAKDGGEPVAAGSVLNLMTLPPGTATRYSSAPTARAPKPRSTPSPTWWRPTSTGSGMTPMWHWGHWMPPMPHWGTSPPAPHVPDRGS